jgi:putative zinc finger/helix-turn-helix YgiT family protein
MLRESFLRAAAVIRAEDGLLAPDDIVGLRKKYGLTQAQLERLIGAGAKTVVRWERGRVAQNKTADTLLRVLLDHPEVVTELKRKNGLAKAPRRRSSATAALTGKSAATARK